MKEAFYAWDNSVWLSQWNVKKYLDILVREGNNRSKSILIKSFLVNQNLSGPPGEHRWLSSSCPLEKSHHGPLLISSTAETWIVGRKGTLWGTLECLMTLPSLTAFCFFYDRDLNCGKQGNLVQNSWVSHDSAHPHSLLLLWRWRWDMWEIRGLCEQFLSVSWLFLSLPHRRKC